jgi:menaquinone-dependent protoporphyrinogen IX oxidase
MWNRELLVITKPEHKTSNIIIGIPSWDSMTRGLVLFATKYGSTQELAETLAEKLGFTAKNVMQFEDGSELDQYDVLVLGSPIYYDDICDDMKHFITSFFFKLGDKKLVTFSVYGATKGYLETDYAAKFANYFDPKPALSVMFLGRATKSSLSEADYRKLQIFYRNRLNAELSDFDYFDENKVDFVVEKIKEVI